MRPEEYYKLYEDESKRDLYCETLKKLSDQTTSRDFFQNQVDKKWYEKRQQLHDEILKKSIDGFGSQVDKSSALESQMQKEPAIKFIVGSIGSGKTSAKDELMMKEENRNYLYINFDAIKKELPEYGILKNINPEKAAEFVQSESAVISSKLLKKAIKEKVNIIYEKNLTLTKDNELHIIREIKTASKKGYLVSVYVVFLDSIEEALKRVKQRAIEIKRYVSDKKVKETFNDLFPLFNRIIKHENLKIESVHFLYNGNKEISNMDNDRLIDLGLMSLNLIPENYDEIHGFFSGSENFLICDNKDKGIFGLLSKIALKALPMPAINQLEKLDFFKMDMSSKLTKKEYEEILSNKETERKIQMIEAVIKNKTARKQSISFLKALDGKRIRNTSGT